MPTTTDKLALHGGTPVRGPEKEWPAWPQHDETERAALLGVLESSKWWYGEQVKQFEQDYAAFQDAAHCVTCCSGTQAAEIVMQALGIGPGDEVIVPPYTFVATAMSVARVGAVPVFADVDHTWCLDPDAAEAAITERTKAIMPVHFGASLADMDRFKALASKYNLVILEDACHSWGSKWNGKGTGALGTAGVFSFQQSKNITAAEGGCILTDDGDLAARCRSIVNCGRVDGAAWFEHPVLGTNARITEFQAAVLNCQLARQDGHNARRAENAARLDAAFANIDGLTPQPVLPQVTKRSYHLYCMRFDAAQFGCSRAKFIEAALAEGLKIAPGYGMPLYRQGFLKSVDRDYGNDECPVTEDLCANSALWMHHSMLLGTAADMDDIVTVMQKVRANASSLGG